MQVAKAQAHGEMEEQQVKAEKHLKQADAIRAKEEKKAMNEAEKEMAKDGLAQKKAAAAHAYENPNAVVRPGGGT